MIEDIFNQEGRAAQGVFIGQGIEQGRSLEDIIAHIMENDQK